jgi:hypothetical protein
VDVVHVVSAGAAHLVGSISEVTCSSKPLSVGSAMSLKNKNITRRYDCTYLGLVDVLHIVVQVVADYSGRALGVGGLGSISQSFLCGPSAHAFVLLSLGLCLLAIRN